MTRGNYANRTDANHKELVACFKSLGVSVTDLSAVGKGCPDLMLGFANGINVFVEIKDGKKPKSAQKLTEAEQKFFDTWKGMKFIVTSEQEAVDLVNHINSLIIISSDSLY